MMAGFASGSAELPTHSSNDEEFVLPPKPESVPESVPLSVPELVAPVPDPSPSTTRLLLPPVASVPLESVALSAGCSEQAGQAAKSSAHSAAFGADRQAMILLALMFSAPPRKL